MKKWIFILLNFILLSSNTGQQSLKIGKAIRNILKYDLENVVESLEIAVLDHDSVYHYHVGWENSNLQKQSIDTNAVVCIGGLSKIFTANIIFELTKEKILDIEKPINLYLPQKFKCQLGNKITAAQLLSHASGLPKNLPNMNDIDSDISVVYRNISSQILIDNLNILDTNILAKGFLNSNINFALLQILIESITKDTYENILQKYIAHKYLLKSTSTISPKEKVIRYVKEQEMTYPDFNIFNASLGIKSNMQDLVTYLKKSFKNKDQRIFERRTKIDENNYATLGMYETLINSKLSIYSQMGITNGYSSFWTYNPTTQTSVIILSNKKSSLNELGFLILKSINNNWKRKS